MFMRGGAQSLRLSANFITGVHRAASFRNFHEGRCTEPETVGKFHHADAHSLRHSAIFMRGGAQSLGLSANFIVGGAQRLRRSAVFMRGRCTVPQAVSSFITGVHRAASFRKFHEGRRTEPGAVGKFLSLGVHRGCGVPQFS